VKPAVKAVATIAKANNAACVLERVAKEMAAANAARIISVLATTAVNVSNSPEAHPSIMYGCSSI